MKNWTTLKNQNGRRLIAFFAALAVAFSVALPQPAHAQEVTVPPVPANLRVEKGNVAFLEGHAVGTQNYVCLPSGTGFAFSLFTPQATLFDDDGDQIITHFFSPNPDPADRGAIRATWEDSQDTSTIWAAVEPDGASTDQTFVARNSIPWLLLRVVGRQEGPDGGDRLTETTFVQRLNTSGGVAPANGCSSLADVGTRAFVPYTADYYFYRKSDRDK